MRPAVPVVSNTCLDPKFRQFTPIFRQGAAARCVASCEGANRPQQVLAGGEDCSLALLNYETGHVMRRWVRAHEKTINSITRPLASGMFATGGRDNMAKVWQLTQDDPVAELGGHTMNVSSVDLHPTDPLLVSGSKDNTVRLWDLQQQEELYCGDIKMNVVHFVKFVPTVGCVAQGGEDLTLRLWDVRKGPGGFDLSLSCTLEGLDYFPTCCEIIGSRPHTILTGHSGVNGCGSYIGEWDLRMQKCLRLYTGHKQTVSSLRLATPSVYGEDKFFSASKDGVVGMWSIATDPEVDEVAFTEQFPVPEGPITSAECMDNGDFITAHENGCMTVFKSAEKGGPPCKRYRYVGIMTSVR
ncbi:WDdomain 31 [Angomonas deanei]|uniref:WD domain, G-beta repeat, putative n=1 Tax=Angomonas deanei TaxID=59799 RepID=A0A7G2CM40_9TRYP|nr:WDdomain 31 [Angomonas deanei]CAD2220908.1 WD domain, G-beta repeat, putative [Angomonas deanei]|eukprot:EPY38700.1 WDdomain 31 [Angomonas deanei]